MAASKQAEYGEAVLECLEYSSDALLIDFAWDPLRVNDALAGVDVSDAPS